MTPQTPILAAALAACLTLTPAFAQAPGMVALEVADDARPLEGFLWYPTDATEGAEQALGNAVWEAVAVIPEAAPTPGPHPMVLLSHGMYGNARNQAWLAAALTRAGYIVAAIDHPGTSSFQRDPDAARMLWERPHDISRALDHILTLEGFGALVDRDRIFMAGHSLGGWTAMMLAGARYAPERMDAVCAAAPEDLVCGIFARWQVAQSEADRAEIARDWSDPRIAAVAVFDLGGTQSFAQDSLAGLETPLLVIGAPVANSGIDLDVESRALVAGLPEGTRYLEPAGLAHFDFLGVCTPEGFDILTEEEPEDAMVCEEGTEERRAEHAMIAEAVIRFFDAQ